METLSRASCALKGREGSDEGAQEKGPAENCQFGKKNHVWNKKGNNDALNHRAGEEKRKRGVKT